MNEEGEDAARGRRARSHSRRRAILTLLSSDRAELTPGQIRDALPDDPPLGDVNYHLRVLGETRLVTECGGCYRLP